MGERENTPNPPALPRSARLRCTDTNQYSCEGHRRDTRQIIQFIYITPKRRTHYVRNCRLDRLFRIKQRR